MHCCQCHYFIACCCQPVDCCSLFIQRISCYALAAMQPTPLTLLLLPPIDFLHPFTQLPCGHSCRQHRCYCAMMLLPLPCIGVMCSCCLLDHCSLLPPLPLQHPCHPSLPLPLPSLPLPLLPLLSLSFPLLCCCRCRCH